MAFQDPNPLGSAPAVDFAAITPHDTTNFGRKTRAVYVGSIAGGATIIAVNPAGTAVTFAGVVAGSILPIQVTRINNTGTTASSLVGLY